MLGLKVFSQANNDFPTIRSIYCKTTCAMADDARVCRQNSSPPCAKRPCRLLAARAHPFRSSQRGALRLPLAPHTAPRAHGAAGVRCNGVAPTGIAGWHCRNGKKYDEMCRKCDKRTPTTSKVDPRKCGGMISSHIHFHFS